MVQRRPPHGDPPPGKKVVFIARYRDPSGRQRSKSFAKEKDAKQFERDQETKLARGMWINPDDEKTTVVELVDEWIGQARTDGTKGVLEGFRANLGPLAKMPIGAVRPSHVRAWVMDLRDGRPWKDGKPLADLTVDMHIGRLKTVMDRAVDDRMINRSPVTKSLRREVMADKMVDVRQVPSPEQVRLMCRVATAGGLVPKESRPLVKNRRALPPSPWMATAIRLGVDTGLRVGEMSGLLWKDVDLEERTISVRRSCGGKLQVYGPLKTVRAEREVPLSTPMVRELAGLVRGPDDPVIEGASGRGTSSQNMSGWMRVLGLVAGVDGRLHRYHGFRHLYASSLLLAGEPITTVAALIGDSVPTTSRVYAHFMPGAAEATRSSINRLAGLVRDQAPSLRVVGD